MLSRVADSIYWMSRYVERVENIARFIDVTLNMILDQPESSINPWQPLVSTTGDQEWFRGKYPVANEETVIRFLTTDCDYPGSILSSLRFARENARSVRETISSEMWEHLNQFYYMVREAADGNEPLESSSDFFHEVKMASHLFQGLTDATMSHNEGWHFARLGRMLERADKTTRILDVKYFLLLPALQDVDTPVDDLQWSAVLRSVSGLEMYRKKHHGITPHRVLEFLVLDRDFPRAVHHCIQSADESLRAIAGTSTETANNPAQQRIGELRAELEYGSVEEIVRNGLHEFLDRLQTKINDVDNAIYATYISIRPVEPAAKT